MSDGQTNCNNCSAQLTEEERSGPGHGSRGTVICGNCARGWERPRRNGWLPVMQWEDHSEGLRLASGNPIPWADPKVALISITKGHRVKATHTWNGKVRMLEEARPEDLLLVAWPGQRRQDVFIVDDRRTALRKLKAAA